jgi:hypothetical protein
MVKMKETAPKATNYYRKFMEYMQCGRNEFISGRYNFLKEKNISIIILE